MFYDWKPYVPMSVRRQEAVRELQRLKKKGQSVSPVVIEGRKIAQSFWGARSHLRAQRLGGRPAGRPGRGLSRRLRLNAVQGCREGRAR